MAQIIERVQAHYEAREVPFGKVYEWHPAHVAFGCDCGEKETLTATTAPSAPVVGAAPTSAASSTTSRSAKAVVRTSSPTPGSTMPKRGRSNACGTRPLILRTRPGVTTILRQKAMGRK